MTRKLEWDIHHKFWRGEGLPQAWHDLAIEKGPGPKEKVTLYVDKRVLKFFRATGKGWQTRMNLVLESYALARAAGAVRGVERFDLERSARRNDVDGPPQGFGHAKKYDEEIADGTWKRRLRGEEPMPEGPHIPPDETREERADRENYDDRQKKAEFAALMLANGRKKGEVLGWDEPERHKGPLD